MGVTIHFEGQLWSEEAYRELIELVSSISTDEGWRTKAIESKEVTLLRVRDEQNWDYTGPVKGVLVSLHEDCDPVRFEFDRNLYIQEFTKTQFAGPEIHLKVLDLLKTVRPFFLELKVQDEGEYWETGDLRVLAAQIERSRKVIEEELRKSPRGKMKVKTPEGRILDLIT